MLVPKPAVTETDASLMALILLLLSSEKIGSPAEVDRPAADDGPAECPAEDTRVDSARAGTDPLNDGPAAEGPEETTERLVPPWKVPQKTLALIPQEE